jgi:hypothetical protein
MDLGEKVLYHQIHPAKLTADVSGSLVSTYLMWRHKFVAALLSAFGPATIASVLVIRYADLEKRKHSPFGRYMHRYMNRRVEAWRFFGASADMGWRMAPSRQACTHRVGHSRRGLDLRALA